MPTNTQIMRARTPRGGWTKKQLAIWGVPWPPPKGWKRKLIAENSKSMAAHRVLDREWLDAMGGDT